MDADGHPKHYLLEEAREVDWSDEQILEALSLVALNEWQSLIANAGGLPIDQIDAAQDPVRGVSLPAGSSGHRGRRVGPNRELEEAPDWGPSSLAGL